MGARFNQARLPLDVLSDLPAFRDLVAALAKHNWRLQNADRQRLPKGFEQSITFDLIDVADGSAVPVIAWHRESPQDSFPGISEHIEELIDEAYSRILNIIEDANYGHFPRSLPGDVIKAFNKFGSSLRSGEHVEFVGSKDRGNNVISFDAERRRRLLKEIRTTYDLRITGIGRYYGHDADAGYIKVETSEYGHINIQVSPDEVRRVYDGNADARVQFDLLVELDHEDNLRSVKDVFEVDLIDDHISENLDRCGDRLTKISALKSGWHNGDGESPSPEVVDLTARFILRRAGIADRFRIFPTLAGGTQIEFESPLWDITIEFLVDRSIELSAISLEDDREYEPARFDGLSDDLLRAVDQLSMGIPSARN